MGSEAEDAGEARRLALHAYKRKWIVDAARTVFARDGVTRASMREIAKHAGYTVGVLYHYVRSKEELYSEVLQGSLGALVDDLERARDGAPAGRCSGAAFDALYRFYRERPVDFDLSFYLYQGARPVGLYDDLDRRLNQRVDDVMDVLAGCLVADGVAAADRAHPRAVAVMSALFGVVLMTHTGRLRSLAEDPDALVALLLADTLGSDHVPFPDPTPEDP